jgi:hypothetical protein
MSIDFPTPLVDRQRLHAATANPVKRYRALATDARALGLPHGRGEQKFEGKYPVVGKLVSP